MKLLFVARAIDGMAGGVERMIITIMNAMVERGHEVSLLSWDQAAAGAFYPMADAIQWHRLNLGDAQRKANLALVLVRRRTVQQIVSQATPDLIVCFQGGPFMAMQLYTAGLGIPIIAAERTAPTLYDHVGSSRQRLIEHFAFRFAACITIQFSRYRRYYPKFLHSRLVTIPNPVHTAGTTAVPARPDQSGRWKLLSIGRLSYQKNMDVLIDAFVPLARRFPLWDLRIVGGGEQHASLEEQVARHSLAGRVDLAGPQHDVQREYAAAHLFCLPSRWEGFPNALAEALAHGLPAAGFSSCAGVADLIVPRQNGALCTGSTASDLTETLAPLMEDAALRARLGTTGRHMMRAYQPAAIFSKWEEVFAVCAARGGSRALQRLEQRNA